MTIYRKRMAVAHWIELVEDGRTLACFDTENGETLVIDVTDAPYGGVIRERDSEVDELR